ncbi:MAG TPA: FtsQ-type POTRA domain-containing protein [Actinomycetota bacterium]|nr:FtsQ-type POTRA domain-containing protein [Actinomycetota bacterium]
MRTRTRRPAGPVVVPLRRRRWRPRLRTSLVALSLLTAAAAGAWFWTALHVRVAGVQTVPAQTVIEASGLRPGNRMVLTRLDSAARSVRSLPQVRTAHVRRVLPATLEIRVTERVPLVRLQARRDLAADSEGVFVPAQESMRLPTLSGWQGQPREGERLTGAGRTVLRAYSGFPGELRAMVSVIDVAPEVTLAAGRTKIRMGRPEQLHDKARAALAVLRDAAAKGTELEYVDVRAPRTPVARARAGTDPAAPGDTGGSGGAPPVASTPTPGARRR